MTLPCTVILRTTARREVFLARALASVRAQTAAPEAVVVVGDGMSAAELETEVERGGRAGPAKVELAAVAFRSGRAGAADAGLRRAATEWFAFLDDDDTWAPTFLEEMFACAGLRRAEPGFGGAVCRTEAIYERMTAGVPEELEREPFNPGLAAVDARALARRNLFTIHAVLWHRRVAERLGGFRKDLPVLEDWEFNLRAVREFELEVLPRTLARYHLRPPDDAVPNSAEKEHDRVARELRAQWAREGRAGEESAGFWAELGADLLRRWRRARASARWRRRLAR